jgi:hypothetical protein
MTKKTRKREIEDLEFVKSIAIVRRDAAGPRAEMSLPAELKKKNGKSTINDSYVYYTDAAACGIMALGSSAAGGGGADG